MKTKILFLIILGTFLIHLVSAGNLTLFPNPGESDVYIEYTFNFSKSNNCLPANIILNYTTTVHTNTRGFGYVSIDISSLSEVPLRLCEYKDGVLRKNHSFSSIIFQSTSSQNLNLSGNAIIKGWVNVTGNVTARYFIGNGSQLTSVCLEDGTNCPAGFADTQKNTSGIYLYNDSSTIYFNETQLNNTIDDRATGLGDNATWNQSLASSLYVDLTGDIMSGDLNMSLNKLTTIGELIMAGIIRGQNITPVTHNLYSLGNSTNWFKELFVGDIQSINVNTTNLNATNIKSSDIESDEINTTNLTVAGYNITEKSGDLVISLT